MLFTCRQSLIFIRFLEFSNNQEFLDNPQPPRQSIQQNRNRPQQNRGPPPIKRGPPPASKPDSFGDSGGAGGGLSLGEQFLSLCSGLGIEEGDDQNPPQDAGAGFDQQFQQQEPEPVHQPPPPPQPNRTQQPRYEQSIPGKRLELDMIHRWIVFINVA